MATRRSSDWWDNLLYLGLFILIALFLYQLLKLWQTGTKTLSNFIGWIPSALANTVSAVEGALSASILNPFGLVTALFDGVPTLLGWVVDFFSTIILGPIGGVLGTTAGSAINAGLGSSNVGTAPTSNGTSGTSSFVGPILGDAAGGLGESFEEGL